MDLFDKKVNIILIIIFFKNQLNTINNVIGIINNLIHEIFFNV